MAGIDLIQDLGLVMLVAAFAGWLCQRIGLPVVIGYLGAGICVSPHTHSFSIISDPARINALAQIGLVFLIFNIGQGITLQRIKRVGLPLVFGTLLTAVFVLVGCRWVATVLNWPAEHGLVLAAMLMVSSTAVLGKTLREAKATHSTFGQTALTITALDDLVAIVMLTVLTSVIQVGGADAGSVLGTVLRLKAVIITLIIASLLLVPPLLNRINRAASTEIGALAIAGLLLAMALLSAKAGFSAALGAFLLGTIVSTTGRNEQVGRVMTGLSDVFGPVFFVAMGMLFNYKLIGAYWPIVLGVFVLAVVLRLIGATLALLMVGQSVHDATRAALCLTPIGEVSLILALTGVQGGIVPSHFYAVAVGVCLLTSLTTPWLIRHSSGISAQIEKRQPEFLAQWIGLYHEWVENLKQRQHSSVVWRLTMPRVFQTTTLVLFISGLLIFASPLYFWTEKWLGADWPFPRALPTVFWSGLALLVIAPMVAVWRQIEALSMILAESATRGKRQRAAIKPIFEKLLKGSVSLAILFWFATLIPYDVIPDWGFVLIGALAIGIGWFFWRQLIRLQSRFEIELKAQLSDSPFAADKPQLPGWPKRNGHWKMTLAEVVLREGSSAVGTSIAELPLRNAFGCTLVSIERQGMHIRNPGAETVLYPNDKLLLLGSEEKLHQAEEWLNQPAESPMEAQSQMAEMSLAHLVVPASSRHLGRTLSALGVHSNFGVQIVGIERDGKSLLSPGPAESLESGDQLLVLGSPRQVSEMAFWLTT